MHSHSHGHGGPDEEQDFYTWARANLTGFRTFVEHITIWGQLASLAGCPPLACVLVGLGMGYMWGREDRHAHGLIDSANEAEKKEDIARIKAQLSLTDVDIAKTVVSTRDLISVQAHVHDEGTINYCFFASMMYTAITATMPGESIASWLALNLGASAGTLATLRNCPYTTLENITFKITGAISGFICTKADERTSINQAQHVTFWRNYHGELRPKVEASSGAEMKSNSNPTNINSLTFRAKNYLQSCRFWGGKSAEQAPLLQSQHNTKKAYGSAGSAV